MLHSHHRHHNKYHYIYMHNIVRVVRCIINVDIKIHSFEALFVVLIVFAEDLSTSSQPQHVGPKPVCPVIIHPEIDLEVRKEHKPFKTIHHNNIQASRCTKLCHFSLNKSLPGKVKISSLCYMQRACQQRIMEGYILNDLDLHAVVDTIPSYLNSEDQVQ